MSDRELLELAAKAAGIKGSFVGDVFAIAWGEERDYWNPLTDDGDALRLAVKLGLVLDAQGDKTFCGTTQYDAIEHHKDDPYAATRRAIVRAAAEIGKTL